MEKIKIVAIDGAVRKDSMSRQFLFKILESFNKNTTILTLFDQSQRKLPLYDDSPELLDNPDINFLLNSVKEADIVILSSPEYHGSMSGALKNALDWCTHVEGRFKGKLVGLVGGGASFANSGANIQMMMAVRAMHGWLMPEVLLSAVNIWDVFDEDGEIIDPILSKRLQEFVKLITSYGKVFRELNKRNIVTSVE